MAGELFVWLLSFFLLLGLIVWQLMCLADLDYINPYDYASRINSMALPEFIAQGIVCLLFLLTGHWVMFLLGAPTLYYDFRVYQNRWHLGDFLDIIAMIIWEKQFRPVKLRYLVVLLFLSMFWMIWTALGDD